MCICRDAQHMCVYMHRMVFTPLNFMCLTWETGHTCLSTCIIARERAAASEGALSAPCHGCLALEGVNH